MTDTSQQHGNDTAGTPPIPPPKTVKFRCPFCQVIFEPAKGSCRCPACGKFMMIPPHLRPEAGDRKKKRKTRIEKPPPENAVLAVLSKFTGRRRISVLFGVIGVLVIAGIMLVQKASETTITQRPSKEGTTTTNLVVLRTAVELFYRDCQRYPTTQESLKALVRNPAPKVPGWKGPYINLLRNDSWFTPFRYELRNDSVVLSSAGPDGRHGTRDDILAPQPDIKLMAEFDSVTNATFDVQEPWPDTDEE